MVKNKTRSFEGKLNELHIKKVHEKIRDQVL